MSKERDLLIRVRDVLRGLKETHYDLYWDIQTALDQPEQEPVAWMQDDIELYVQEEKDIVRGYVIPLYLAPPKREPLSEDEIAELWWNTYVVGTADSVRNFARAIEKAHGIGGEE